MAHSEGNHTMKQIKNKQQMYLQMETNGHKF